MKVTHQGVTYNISNGINYILLNLTLGYPVKKFMKKERALDYCEEFFHNLSISTAGKYARYGLVDRLGDIVTANFTEER